MKKSTLALALLASISTGTALANQVQQQNIIVDGIDCVIRDNSACQKVAEDVTRAGSNAQAEYDGWRAARRGGDEANKFFDGSASEQDRANAAIDYLAKTTDENGNDTGAKDGMDQVVTKINDNNVQSAHDHMRMDGYKALAAQARNAGFEKEAKQLEAKANEIYQRSVENRKQLGGDYDEVRKHNDNMRIEQDRITDGRSIQNKQKVNENSKRIDDTNAKIDDSIKAGAAGIATNRVSIEKNAKAIDANTQRSTKNQSDIKEIRDNQNEFAKSISDVANKGIETNKIAREANERSVENEQRIGNIEKDNKVRDDALKSTADDITKLDKKIDENRRVTDKRIGQNEERYKQDKNALEKAAKDYDKQVRSEFEQWENDAKKYVDDKIKNGQDGRDVNRGDIDKNRGDIDKNRGDIDKNRGDIDKNRGDIDKNRSDIDKNREDINKNRGDIDKNRGDIDKNTKSITDTNKRITDEVNKQGDVNKQAKSERDANKDAIKDTNKRLDATNEQVDKNAKNIDANKKRIDEELENQDKVNKQAKADREENRNKITDTNKRIDDEIAIGDEFARQASDVVVSNADKISENSQQISRNSVRIDNLEDALVRQGEEMRERYDGVKASTHAAMSARAFTSEPGEFAVGAGIGAAGSKRALAIGGAYQFNENWSGNFIGSYETAGKYTKSDLAVGVGAQYTFK
ncbi:hypothetical protein JCM19235_5689 [Vibrio maritimus]|uniref:Trimeric autotransporter adhesin YadA-like C-terminal membrane anchor domain-containing protein n=1 Tax=Vibrio maritimus TaxID=990268 RepID=A0A090RNZ9_9VIBR|nr:hypothetical protein JCM19235_5689 [Vibrio maritimus]